MNSLCVISQDFEEKSNFNISDRYPSWFYLYVWLTIDLDNL